MGLKSKRIGQHFEEQVSMEFNKAGIAYIRLPEFGCKVTKTGDKRQTIVCDFIIAFKNQIMLIDTKTINKKRVSYSDVHGVNLVKGKVKRKSFFYQALKMSKFQKESKATYPITGFLISFKPLLQICFLEARTLFEMEKGESLGPEDGFCLKNSKDLVNLQYLFKIGR